MPPTSRVAHVIGTRWRRVEAYSRYRYAPNVNEYTGMSPELFLQSTGAEILSGDPNACRIDALRFSTFLILRLQISELHLGWSREHEIDQHRCVSLFVNRGAVTVTESTNSIPPDNLGTYLVLTGKEPVTMQISRPSELIVFSFDEAEASPLPLVRESVLPMSADSTFVRCTYAFLATVAIGSDESTGEVGSLRSLLRGFARELADQVGVSGYRDDPFSRAQTLLEQHANDPSFSIAKLADMCSVSRRTLTRLYERHGLQPSAALRRARLREAAALIRAGTELSMGEIAHSSGFGSVSSLNRAFREMLEASPSDLRMKPQASRQSD